MKLRDYIKYLRTLEKDYSDFDVIFSIDEEGNGYKHVGYEPSLCKIKDLSKYHLEMEGFYRNGENIKKKDCNAICIN